MVDKDELQGDDRDVLLSVTRPRKKEETQADAGVCLSDTFGSDPQEDDKTPAQAVDTAPDAEAATQALAIIGEASEDAAAAAEVLQALAVIEDDGSAAQRTRFDFQDVGSEQFAAPDIVAVVAPDSGAPNLDALAVVEKKEPTKDVFWSPAEVALMVIPPHFTEYDLVRLGNWKDPEDRRSALAILQRRPDAGERYAEEIACRLEDEFSDIRGRAQWILRQIPEDAMPCMVERLHHANVSIRRVALDIMSSNPATAAQYADEIASCLADKDSRVRSAALGLLQMLPEAASRFNREIAAGLTDADSDARLQALRALKNVPDDAGVFAGEVTACLSDSDHWVRGCALRTLLEMPEASAPFAAARLTDKDPAVRWRALTVLNDMPEAAAPYRSQVDMRTRDRNKGIRELARGLVVQIPIVVRARLADENEEVRRRTLGIFMRAPKAAPRFMTEIAWHMGDDDIECRQLSQDILQWSDSGEDNLAATSVVVEEVVAHLAHEDPDVRQRALDTLSRIPDAVEPLAAHVAVCFQDTDVDVRRWAVYVFRQISWGVTSTFATELAACLIDEDTDVLNKTTELLALIPDAAAKAVSARLTREGTSSEERRRALVVLAMMPTIAKPYGPDYIAKCVQDSDKQVRMMAGDLLKKFAKMAN